MKSFSFKVLYLSLFVPSILYVLTLPFLESQVQEHIAGHIRRQLIQAHDQLLEGTASLYDEMNTNISAVLQGSLAVRFGALPKVRIKDAGGAVLYPYYDRLIFSLQQEKGLTPPPTKYFDRHGFILRHEGLSWEELQERYLEFINGLQIEVAVSIPITSWLGSVTLLLYIFMVVVVLYLYFLRSRKIEDGNLQAITQEMTQRFETEKQEYAQQINERLKEAQERLTSIRNQEEEWLLEVERLEKEKISLEDELLDSMEQSEEQKVKLHTLEEEAAQQEGKKSKSFAKEEKMLEERFARLYRNLEMDRASFKGFTQLKDDKAKLAAEEMLKRLNDGDPTLKIRRKIAGVAGCDAFELGFGSKGRIYYISSKFKQFRVVRIGTKTTQNKDLAAMQGMSA